MTRTEYFNTLGNNCRVLGLDAGSAWKVIENVSDSQVPEDSDDFWYGYVYGKNTEVVDVSDLESACSCGAKLSGQDSGICHHCLYEAEHGVF